MSTVKENSSPKSNIIDGKAYAKEIREQVALDVARLKKKHDLQPGLAVVVVGDDPASQTYVKNKRKHAEDAGIASFAHVLTAQTSQKELLELIDVLNYDKKVHGILVQLPLPAHIDETKIINAIDFQKDVDGFHPQNVGLLSTGQEAIVPCTPQGIILLLKRAKPDLSGLHAIMIGRSNIVGKPTVQLLLQENCTVTIAHSYTTDLHDDCRQADIVISAVGTIHLVRSEWVKQGAIVIDVGINRIPNDEGKSHLAGDVDFDNVSKVASAITPVPGGVGPMTIACLLKNTVKIACTQNNIKL